MSSRLPPLLSPLPAELMNLWSLSSSSVSAAPAAPAAEEIFSDRGTKCKCKYNCNCNYSYIHAGTNPPWLVAPFLLQGLFPVADWLLAAAANRSPSPVPAAPRPPLPASVLQALQVVKDDRALLQTELDYLAWRLRQLDSLPSQRNTAADGADAAIVLASHEANAPDGREEQDDPLRYVKLWAEAITRNQRCTAELARLTDRLKQDVEASREYRAWMGSHKLPEGSGSGSDADSTAIDRSATDLLQKLQLEQETTTSQLQAAIAIAEQANAELQTRRQDLSRARTDTIDRQRKVQTSIHEMDVYIGMMGMGPAAWSELTDSIPSLQRIARDGQTTVAGRAPGEGPEAAAVPALEPHASSSNPPLKRSRVPNSRESPDEDDSPPVKRPRMFRQGTDPIMKTPTDNDSPPPPISIPSIPGNDKIPPIGNDESSSGPVGLGIYPDGRYLLT
ncbi:Uu.00g134230.m01.CDS01 [Anthostomella pinea]|uniref:Uu.00g134230.m01.CDS01 n=1 Tax=Anthostomella pinea TaxID=933095 RepID=A0AAI8VPM6_9PEZI|nr:Uu.00g134230.m01.CDS01 [Anthostomella pinea]